MLPIRVKHIYCMRCSVFIIPFASSFTCFIQKEKPREKRHTTDHVTTGPQVKNERRSIYKQAVA
jgi:hypothetical protein